LLAQRADFNTPERKVSGCVYEFSIGGGKVQLKMSGRILVRNTEALRLLCDGKQQYRFLGKAEEPYRKATSALLNTESHGKWYLVQLEK
jgi:hypothetical protein